MTDFSSKNDLARNNNQVITAIPTLFDHNDKVDLFKMSTLIEFQIDNGIKAIIVGGSTGELLLLKKNEYLDLIKFIKNKYSDKLNIIGCCTSASTSDSIQQANNLRELGIKSILCATPFYVKPNQAGIFEHFKLISEVLPTIIYSVPSRTANDMDMSTIKNLSNLNGIIGYKDATNDVSRTLVLSKYVKEQNLNFKIFAGDDISYLGFAASGANGLISVISNIFPKIVNDIADLISQNDFINARQKFFSIIPHILVANLETNPIVIKYMLHKIFPEINYQCRKPLSSISELVRVKCDDLFNKSANLFINS